MVGFLFGAIAGAAAMWLYGPQIRQFVDEQSRTVREKAVDGLKAVTDTVEQGLGQRRGEQRFEQFDSKVRPGGGMRATGTQE